MFNLASNVFSLSECDKLKKLLKNPEDDFQEIILLLENKVDENTKQINELEEKYYSLINGLTNVGIGIDIVTKDYKVLFQNQVLKERFGDCRDKNCYNEYMGLDEPCSFCPMEKALKYNRVERTELRGIDGNYYELISAPFPNPDGSIDKAVEVVVDITDRKKIENMFLKEKKFTENAINAQRDTFFIFEPSTGKAIRWNQAFKDISGYSDEEISTMKTPDSYYDENDLKQAVIAVEKIIEEGEALIEMNLITKDGRPIPFEYLGSSIIDDDGNLKYIIAIGRDITEKKKIEQKLRESEEKFRNISDQSLIGIGIVQDNIVKYVNKKFADIFGYTVEDMLSWSPKDFMITVHQEDKEFVFDQVKKKQAGSEDYLENYQFRGITKSGEIIWIENFTKTIMYEGKVADFLAFIDITERISAQQELSKLNQLKSELLRRTSHELKTPLVSIKGFSELLLEVHRDKLDALVISTLNEIKHGCLRLETLIGDILKTAELESGAIQLHKSEEDLSFLVRLCVNEIKGFLKLRNHTINLELHEKLITQFEKEQIHQVIGNLLNNAIKYTPPSGIIEIKSDIKDGFIILSIKDNGIGFTEEEKTRIFKQFGKIERYGQGMDIIAEGSGLGLFISKKIIELHGGDIWVESDGRNKGSMFYVSLPLI